MKKLTAFLLTVAMLFTLLLPAQAEEIASTAPADDTAASSVVLPISEKVELKAEDGADSYQWQIRVTDDLWVNISGANSSTLQLSYSMVANVLDDGTAMVRCQSTTGDAVKYSEETSVTVDYDAVPEFTPAEQPDPSTLVVSEAQVVDNGTSDEEPAAEEPAAESEAAAPTAEPEALAPATSENALTEEQVSLFSVAPSKARRMTTNFAAGDPGSDADSGAGSDPDSTPTEEQEPEVKPTYTLEIKYVFNGGDRDGDQAANSWVGSYEEGTPLQDVTVVSPDVTGYAPDIPEINLTEAFPNGLDGNKTLYVKYSPAEVTYTVKYYEQNLEDDNYTEVFSETRPGYTESTVDKGLATEKEGFVALLYDTNTKIAADSSTVVEIYYDRLYYLMTFNLDGGYGVEPIYARYGTPIEVGQPTKAGYTFRYWTQDGTTEAALPGTMPAQNSSYTALWQAADQAKVTVVFWGENANDEYYSYVGSKEIYTKPDVEYTYNPEQPICGLEEHTHTADCLQCTHTHDISCYRTNDGRKLVKDTPRDGVTLHPMENNIWYYTTGLFNSRRHYYVKIGDTYYCAEGDNEQKIIFQCQHQHTEECYTCHKTEHTHTSSCYLSTGMDENLWTFKESDTVTVAADGSSIVNVYYDRVRFTFKFQVNNSKIIYQFTEKWGADIRDQWTFTGSNGESYSPEKGSSWQATNSQTYSQRIFMLLTMPAENITFRRTTSSNSYHTFYYYVEALPGTSGDRNFEGNTYDKEFELRNNFGILYYDEDFFELEGFTRYKSAREDGREYTLSNRGTDPIDKLYFYYTRNRYDLVFYNGNSIDKVYSENKQNTYDSSVIAGTGVLYEDSLNKYDYIPQMPTDLYEEGSCEFAGWYLNPECTGDEYKLDEHTMPLDGLILYAKWVPVTHTVSFYLDDTMKTRVGETVEVPHGEMIASTSVPTKDTLKAANNGQYANEGYELVGWFYKDEDGKEKAFDPANMPVNRDLQLYAKWSSNVLKPYVIRYYTMVDNQKVYIADETTGSALAGSTKTFNAKVGNELYTEYQDGYFPVTSSHSLTIDINDNDTKPSTNTFDFEYVPRKFVYYTVEYVNADTKEPLLTAEEKSSANAVVTEKYQFYSGWMPDAYQKRLILAASTSENKEEAKKWELEHNVITFFYHQDPDHALVHVVHMLQNTVGNDYTPIDENTVMDADINQSFTADVLTDITGASFSHATANGEKIDGVGKDTTQITQTVTNQNLELVLYYNRIEYPYEIHFVNQETKEEIATPVRKQARYEAQVVEKASDYTELTSGYTLADGEQPQKAINIQVEDDSEKVQKNIITFYYVPSTASLTIQKTVSGNYDGQLFLFHVTGGDIDVDVVVPGNQSVTIDDLKVDQEYTVTEDTSWSWRYTTDNPSQAVKLGANGNTVIFTNTLENHQWVDSNDSAENEWNHKGTAVSDITANSSNN